LGFSRPKCGFIGRDTLDIWAGRKSRSQRLKHEGLEFYACGRHLLLQMALHSASSKITMTVPAR